LGDVDFAAFIWLYAITFKILKSSFAKEEYTNQINEKTKMDKDKLKGKNHRFCLFLSMIGIIRKEIQIWITKAVSAVGEL